MGAHTKIEWAHHTVNFWWGCTKVSPACEHCYAERLAKFFSRGEATWGINGKRMYRAYKAVRELLRLDKLAHKRKRRERVFINSMSDTFEHREGFVGGALQESRERLWECCNQVTHLDILLLTKRPENVLSMVPLAWLVKWPAHVWLGFTGENQEWFDKRWEQVRHIPASVVFCSHEPGLGQVTIPPDFLARGKRAWWIEGGESGGKSRPLPANQPRSHRDQCAPAGVPFFFKQWGEYLPFDHCAAAHVKLPLLDAMMHAQTGAPVRVGKKRAGRKLDNCTHNAVPKTPVAA